MKHRFLTRLVLILASVLAVQDSSAALCGVANVQRTESGFAISFEPDLEVFSATHFKNQNNERLSFEIKAGRVLQGTESFESLVISSDDSIVLSFGIHSGCYLNISDKDGIVGLQVTKSDAVPRIHQKYEEFISATVK